MAKKSPKVKIIPQLLAARTDMERAFGDLAGAAIERDRLTACMEADMNDVRAQYADQLSTQNQIIAQHGASLTRWATNNRAEFGKLRSLETAHGWLKFRTGQWQLKCKLKSWQKVLDKIKSFKLELLYVRTVEEVNKEALIADRASDLLAAGRKLKLADLGVAAIQDEHLTIEIKREEMPLPQVILDEATEA